MPARSLLRVCDECRLSASEVAALGAPRAVAQSAGIAFPPRLDNAVESRQREYVAGRLAALGALRQAGFIEPDWLDTSSQRRPVWPTGYIGSIAHSHGEVWAVATSRERLTGVGIDLEPVLGDAAAAEIAASILTADELARLSTASEARVLVTLVFSAKESLYKCLNPLLDTEFDFHDLRSGPVDLENGCVGLRLAIPLAPDFGVGREFLVQFRIEEGMVRTAVEMISR